MDVIKACKTSGFHEHYDSQGGPAWEKCKHVKYLEKGSVAIKVLDLRR